ncbi:MAG: tyrosine-type recombinase/integrase [Ilumatobacteraceae bacterium]
MSDSSKAYLVRFRTADGKQRSKQFKRRRDALAFANVIEVDRQHGTLVDPRLGRITVAEWWDQWWPTVTNLRPSTKARDEQFFRTHARPVFGTTPLGKLDRTALRAWVADLGSPDGSNLAPATIHRVVQLMNKCVNAAFEDRLIAHNPVAKLPLPRIERREMRFLDTDDIWKLADEIDEAYRSFVLLGAFGGLRLGEMLGLRWKRVDLLRRRVDIAETLVSIGGHITFGPPKTKAAVRTVPLPSFVCDELSRRAVPPVDPEGLVFESPEGFPIRATLFRRRVWRAAVAAAGLEPFRIHDLRHTAVSLWVAEGANPKHVAAMAGHTSVSVVLDRYGHLYPHQDDDLMQRLASRAGVPHVGLGGG